MITPEVFLKQESAILREISRLHTEIDELYDLEFTCQPTGPLRHATQSDLSVGNIIWYERRHYNDWRWVIIESVLDNGRFTAYTGLGHSCTMTLNNAWVKDEIEFKDSEVQK